MKLIFKPSKSKKKKFLFVPTKPNKIIWGHSNICPWKISISGRPGKRLWTQDSDRDGVLDAWDCQPFNKRKQGAQHEKQESIDVDKLPRYKGEEDFFKEIERKYPSSSPIIEEDSNIESIKPIALRRHININATRSPINIEEREFERKWDKLSAIEKLKQKHGNLNKISEREYASTLRAVRRNRNAEEAELKRKSKEAFEHMGENRQQRIKRKEKEAETGMSQERKWDERKTIMAGNQRAVKESRSQNIEEYED